MDRESGYFRRKNFYSDDELIASIQKLAKQLGRAPTLQDVRDAREEGGHDIVVPQVFQRRFKGFHHALAASGVETEHILHSKRYESQEMLDALASALLVLNRRPTLPDIDRVAKGGTIPSRRTLALRFGSVHRSLELAGIFRHYALKSIAKFVAQSDHSDKSALHFRYQVLYAQWLNSPDVDLPFSLSRFAYERGTQDLVRIRSAPSEILIDILPERLYVARHELIDERIARKKYSVSLPLTKETSRYHVVVDRKKPIIAQYVDEYQNPHTIHPQRPKPDCNNLLIVNSMLCDAANFIRQNEGSEQLAK